MKTFSHLLQYLAEFFLEWEIFQTKAVEKIKIHILCSETFSENRTVSEIMSKNMVETEGSQTISRRVACWISKATRAQAHARARALTRIPPPPPPPPPPPTPPFPPPPSHTHTRMHSPTIARTRAQKYVILYFLLFHGIKDFLNAPQYYVIHTLLVLLNLAPDGGELLPWRLATSPAGKTPFPVLYETSWDRGLV